MINLKLLDMDVGVPCYSHLHKNGVETAAVIGIAATVIGGAVTYASARDTNEHNDYWNQQNLDFQKWSMLEQERYNSPENQRSMLEQAGYSPYAYIGGTSSSVTGSSAPSITSMQNPMQNVGFDRLAEQLYNFARMKEDVGKTVAETAKTSAETQNLLAQNQYAQQYYEAQAKEQMAAAKLTGNQAEFQRLQNKLTQDSFDYQVNQFALQNKLTSAQIESVSADASLTAWNSLIAKKEYSWIDKIKSAQLDETLARIATEYTKQELNREQAQAAIQQAFMMNSQGKLSESERKRLDMTANDYAKEMFANRALAEWKAIGAQHDAMNSFNPYSYNLYQAHKKGKSLGPASAIGAFGDFMNKVTPKFGFGK